MEIVEVKNKLIDALGAANLDGMSLNDLGVYVQILRAATEIQTANPMDGVVETIKKMREEFEECHQMSMDRPVGITMDPRTSGD